MKKNILKVAVIVAILGLGSTVSAADEVTFKNKAGITPDNVVLYPLDKSLERIKLYFIADDAKKAELIATIAEERLGESEVMTNKGKVKQAEAVLKEYDSDMSQAVDKIKAVSEKKLDSEDELNERIKSIEDKIATAQAKTLEVLAKLDKNGSENAKETLKMVMEMQTAKREAMISILEARKDLIAVKKDLKDAQEVLKNAKASGDETAITDAKTALDKAKSAYDNEKTEYLKVFKDEKSQMKTSVGELKKETVKKVESPQHENKPENKGNDKK